jgi:type I restriction enzyme, S subunit
MRVRRLGDVCEKIGSGFTPRGGGSVYQSSGIPLIRSQNVYNEGFSSSGLAYVNEEQAAALNIVSVRQDDVLLNITGDSVARVCQVPEHFIPARVNQHVAIIRPNKAILNPRYLLYFLRSPQMQQHMLSLASEGGTRKALTKAMIEDFQIPSPPQDEQNFIVEMLGCLDSKIEFNRQINKTLEEIIQALFKHWFVDFEFPNDQGKPYKSSGGSFTSTELGEMPRSWSVSTLEDLSSFIQNGGTPRRKIKSYWEYGTIPWFKTGELKDGPLLYSEEKITKSGLLNSTCKLWEPKTILVALYASPTVGRLGILEVAATANQACSAIFAKPEYGHIFLFFSILFSRGYLQTIAVGAAQQNINQQIIKDMRVITPPPEIAKMFQSKMLPLYNLIVANAKQSRLLEGVRGSLLPKLFSGELRPFGGAERRDEQHSKKRPEIQKKLLDWSVGFKDLYLGEKTSNSR